MNQVDQRITGAMDDFESTPEFQALVVAATGKPERSMGDSVIPAEPPQWGEVRSLARKLLKVADRQLALRIYLIQAEASVNGFSAFHDTLQDTLSLIHDRWDELSPEPDLDDPDDMYYARVNLINELSEQPVFLDTLYRLPLVDIRGIGAFSARDIDISTGVVAGSDEEKARCQEGLIRGAFAESDPARLQQLALALDALPALCRSIESVFSEKTGQAGVLSLDRLTSRIETCRNRFHSYAHVHLEATPDGEPAGDQSEEVDASGPPVDVSAAQSTRSSSLGNRAMVKASFDQILLYYQQYEPSSPVRVLSSRARDFVDKSFFDILQDMVPAQRGNLPALLVDIQKQPLAALLSDCYARFLDGETLPTLSPSAQQADGSTVTAADAGAVNAESATNQSATNVAPGTASTPSLGNCHQVQRIESRQQVLETLQDIENYYVSAEPASPVPLMIADIRKLVPKRFSDLVADFSRLLPATPDKT